MNTPRSSDHPLDFGLIAWLESTRFALPLKGVECRFEVTGTVASVELDQIFYQNARRPLDCTYVFPLPAGAAVYRCELHVNGRVIRAKVEAVEQAREIYTRQKAAGHRAALVESERENLFTLSLGNVQHGDVIVVRLAWFQVVDRAGENLRLLVPTCPGVRYIPGRPLLRASTGRGVVDDTDQVPDASRITPPRIDALHPDAAYFSILGRLSSSDVESGTTTSPSHPVRVRQSEGAMTVEIADGGAVPDRDFVLTWREPQARTLMPAAWHWTEGDETYALVQLRAPETSGTPVGAPQDFYFLVDRSGSMEGAKWTRTCQALQAFVKELGTRDRVWITLFESDFQDFAEAPLPAPAVLADRGFRSMESLGTGGGTELLPAARRVLEQIIRHSADRRATVVLITDGEVGNDEEIMRAFQQAPGIRVHTFGIDTTVNDAFLKSLARQHRGGCWLQTPNDDIAGTIAALGGRLRHPVLTDLSVRGPWEPAQESWPDLHVRERVTVALRGHGTIAPEISGRSPDGREHVLATGLGSPGSEAVKLLWARERMVSLLDAGRQHEAIQLAKKHNLICKGAAFVAWDEAEQVSIAPDAVVQPSLEPARVLFSRAPVHCFSPSYPDASDFCLPAFNEEPAAATFPRHTAEARESLQQAGIPETLQESWMDWIRHDDSRAADRAAMLRQAAEAVTSMRHGSNLPLLRGHVEQVIRAATRGGPEAFLDWVYEATAFFRRLMEIKRRLEDARASREVVDSLCAWPMESGGFDPDRLQTLEHFALSLQDLPFSAAAQRRAWQAFVDSSVDPGSPVHQVVSQWLADTAASEPVGSPAGPG
jgi:Ca-activated chloride channel family protein